MTIFLVFVLLLSAPPIVDPHRSIAVRHDVPDSRYLDLGKQYTSVVRVGENGGDGTLIAPEWVLTAGHVAAGMARRSGGTFRIFVDGDAEGYDVRQVVVHPEFEDMGPHDLALIRISRAVEAVVPTGIYRSGEEKGKMIVLVGHGDTKPGTGGEWVADRKKRGATNIVDDVSEAHIMFDFDGSEDATELEGTSGPGDSGGPAFIEVNGTAYLAGVSSLGEPGKNGPGTYGAREQYVRVSRYADWIDGIIADPPAERFVNLPKPGAPKTVRRGGPVGPGGPAQGVVILEGIGLLVRDVDGKVQMVGRIDQRYPDALLQGGIRPPAIVRSIDGVSVETAKNLRERFDSIEGGAAFSIEFEMGGRLTTFRLTK